MPQGSLARLGEEYPEPCLDVVVEKEKFFGFFFCYKPLKVVERLNSDNVKKPQQREQSKTPPVSNILSLGYNRNKIILPFMKPQLISDPW